jgi:adenine-specific DNA-methyltransferase
MNKLNQKELTPEQMHELQGLKEAYPEIFKNGGLDYQALRELLSEIDSKSEERYHFSWLGKKEANQILQSHTRCTLKPCPEESVNFEESDNIFLEGENLETLKVLQKSYFNKIKMIFIDPPYNTGKDFLYPDNWRDPVSNYLQLSGQADESGQKLISNPETSGRFHSRWLSMMYPRLFLARNLLKEDGTIFISIDDTEVHHLRMIMNEIFGEENFVANIIWQKKYSPANDSKYLSDNHDHILLYARNKEKWRPQLLHRTEKMNSRYKNPDNDPRGLWKPGGYSVKTYSKDYDYPIETPSGKVVYPPKGSCWQTSKENYLNMRADNRIWFGKNGEAKPQIKQFLSEVQQGVVAKSVWLYNEVGHNQTAKAHIKKIFNDSHIIFDTPKPVGLIKRMLELATDSKSNDIILDFFAGSATTGEAVIQKNIEDGGNRRFILIQLPEALLEKDRLSNAVELYTIADIAKERLRRVVKGYDKKEGIPGDFKVFKLISAAFFQDNELITKTVADLKKNLKKMNNELSTNPDDLLYEVFLKEGMDLCCKMESIPLEENQLFLVNSNRRTMLFCLESRIFDSSIPDIIKMGKKTAFLCPDSALTDAQKIELSSQINLKTI